MKFIPDRSPVVLAGAWNRAIFTPEWVSKHLLDKQEEIEVQIAFGIDSSLRFQSDELTLQVLPRQVRIAPKGKESLPAIEECACRILGRLRETPLHAVGFNFSFDAPADPPTLRRLFKFDDTEALTKSGWSKQATTVMHQLTGDAIPGAVLQLLLEKKSDAVVQIALNVEWKTATPDNAAARLNGQIGTSFSAAVSLLNGVYQLELEP